MEIKLGSNGVQTELNLNSNVAQTRISWSGDVECMSEVGDRSGLSSMCGPGAAKDEERGGGGGRGTDRRVVPLWGDRTLPPPPPPRSLEGVGPPGQQAVYSGGHSCSPKDVERRVAEERRVPQVEGEDLPPSGSPRGRSWWSPGPCWGRIRSPSKLGDFDGD